MSETRTLHDEERRSHDAGSSGIQSAVRRFGTLNVLAGLLALVGPAVWGNDDGLVNVEPGLFLGEVAVNGPHAVLHLLLGALGVGASRDAESARTWAEFGALFFGTFAAVGWRRFGFERGIHMIGSLAVDGWGNLGHAAISGYCLGLVAGFESES